MATKQISQCICTSTPYLVSILLVFIFYLKLSSVGKNTTNHGTIRKETEVYHKEVIVKPSNLYRADQLVGLESNRSVKVVTSSLFREMIDLAKSHPRRRKMNDLTKDPELNSMQVLINTWTNGSYSPVHMHKEYSEAFVVLDGALAFFTFTNNGAPTCHLLNTISTVIGDRAIIVEKSVWHAMTAAPPELGWPGHAIIFENSGHKFSPNIPTKILASFAPTFGDNLNGDPTFFAELLKSCPRFSN
eukprot:gene8847-11938_t